MTYRVTKQNQDYSSLKLVILPWNTPFIFKGCLGKTLFIMMILLYIKLPKNTIYLNDLLFLTYGVNKEIKKYILRRQYNTINERLFKTNLLKCCWSQKAELKFSFKYNYNHELVKWWKQDPLSAAHDVCLDPLVPAPGFRLELVVWTFRLVSSWALHLELFVLCFLSRDLFFRQKKTFIGSLTWNGREWKLTR